MPSRTRLRATVSRNTTPSTLRCISKRKRRSDCQAIRAGIILALIPTPSSPFQGRERTEHVALSDSERLELAMQGGALHADEFGGARDIAPEAVDLGAQIFTLEHLARIAQRQAHQVLATVAIRQIWYHRTDILR